MSQCNKGGLDGSTLLSSSGGRELDFKLTRPVAYPVPPGTVVWALYDLSTHSPVLLDSAEFTEDQNRPGVPRGSNGGKITAHSILNNKDTYILSVRNLKFRGCNTPIQTNYTRVSIRPKGVHSYPLAVVSSRDSSDVYLSGLVNGAQGTHASYTADVKLQLPVFFPDTFLGGTTPSGTKKVRLYELAFLSSFDFKASTDPKSNGNSVLIGAGVRATVPVAAGSHARGRLITDWLPYLGYVLEADKNFSNLNDILQFLNYFNTPAYGKTLQFTARPVVGLEAGGNSKTAKGAVYQGTIVRPQGGLHIYANLFRNKTFTRAAFIESDYRRRWPLHTEPASSSDSSGKLTFTKGTSPRDYVSTKIGYDFTQYFGFSIQHDYGSLPPLFTKVQNKYTFGLTFKMGLQYKPK